MKIRENRIIILVFVFLFVSISSCQTTSVQEAEYDEDELFETPVALNTHQEAEYDEDGYTELDETPVAFNTHQEAEYDEDELFESPVAFNTLQEAEYDEDDNTELDEAPVALNTHQEAEYDEDGYPEMDVGLEAPNTHREANNYDGGNYSEVNGIRKRGIKRNNDIINVKNTDGGAPQTVISDAAREQMIRDAKLAAKEQNYEDAIKIADTMIEDKPDDGPALAMKENAVVLMEDRDHNIVLDRLEWQDTIERNRYTENLKEMAIPYQDMVKYPPKEDWDKFKQRVVNEDMGKRLEESREHTERLQVVPSPSQNILSQEMRDALNMKLSVEFISTPLRDVIAFFQEKTKVNFVISEDAANTSVTIKLNDVSVNTILNYILPQGIDLVIRDEIVKITLDPLEMRVYDIRDLLINIADRQPLSTGGGAARSGGRGAAASGGAGEGNDTFARVQEIMALITTTIEPSSWSATGGRGIIGAREGMLGDVVVTHVSGVHKQIEDLLASLRSSSDLQVNIEARFIHVSDRFLEEFGHSFVDFNTAIENDPNDDPNNNVADPDIRNGGVFTFPGAGNFIDNATATGTGLNLGWRIFDKFFMTGFLRAVHESDEAETVTSPNITLSNTQRGRLRVVTTQNYISSYTIVSDNPQPVISQIDDGTTLNVRPIVSADRKYVSLEVHPIITTVAFDTFEFQTASEGGNGLGTGNVTRNTIELPFTAVQELSVTVSVPDKGILLIGGLGSSSETKTSRGVPFLSKIPIIKRLFSSDRLLKNMPEVSNLIILIQPTILIRGETENRSFAKNAKEEEFKYRPR